MNKPIIVTIYTNLNQFSYIQHNNKHDFYSFLRRKYSGLTQKGVTHTSPPPYDTSDRAQHQAHIFNTCSHLHVSAEGNILYVITHAQPGPVQSEFYTFSLVQSVWSGPKSIHNPDEALFNCEIEMLSAHDQLINFWLCRFVLEIRQHDGERYPPASLYQLCCGILCHLRAAG